MIQRCFALPYYVYCLRLRCLVSFLFYSTINHQSRLPTGNPLFHHFEKSLLRIAGGSFLIAAVMGILTAWRLQARRHFLDERAQAKAAKAAGVSNTPF
ncbi:Uncharacterised protein [Neisseria animalis]|nr:Uncharacterised protein [Neisseria animalis]